MVRTLDSWGLFYKHVDSESKQVKIEELVEQGWSELLTIADLEEGVCTPPLTRLSG